MQNKKFSGKFWTLVIVMLGALLAVGLIKSRQGQVSEQQSVPATTQVAQVPIAPEKPDATELALSKFGLSTKYLIGVHTGAKFKAPVDITTK